MTWDVEAILVAVRDELRARLGALGGRVYVVAEEGLLPEEARFPAGTVRDGGTEIADAYDFEPLATHTVVVSLFTQDMTNVEATVIGSAGTAGVEALASQMIVALKDNTLGGLVLDGVRPVRVSGTDVYLDAEAGQEVVRKSVEWEYRQKPSF